MEFVAKQMMSNKLGAVKVGELTASYVMLVPGNSDPFVQPIRCDSCEKSELGKIGDKEPTDEELKRVAEIEEARKEAEDKRQEKHRKMEAEREVMRSDIRSKYNLKKKEIPVPIEDDDKMGMTRKKKTPEEMAREKEMDLSDKPLMDQVTEQITQLTDRATKAVEQCNLS